MKKILAIVLVVVLMATLIPGVALADPDKRGNDLPKGKSYNFNVIAVPKAKHLEADDFDFGGNGKRIFILRTGTTKFYVQGQEGTFAIMDHDGTDGSVGTNEIYEGHLLNPGIILPYDTSNDKWDCTVYVRLLGPAQDPPHLQWTTSYYDGSAWAALDSFPLDRNTKFAVPGGQIFKDNYEDIMWTWDAKHNLRICQFRIYVND